ncbi:MAG: hypothetical protein QM737_20225 [Ferruginibacter sp.]
MKKMSIVMMLLISINGKLFAQKNNADKVFEMPANSITRIFFIDLDKGDKIKLELGDLDDLDAITNLDSILRVFIQDIEPLKDSLADELTSKRIDYIVDPSGKNKLRIQQFAPNGSSYLVNQGFVATMKLEQDTVNILLKAQGGSEQLFKKRSKGFHYYRISFFVNNLGNLTGYMNGRLQNSIASLQKNATDKWVNGKDGMMYSKKDRSISSNMSRGQVTIGDFLTFRLSADIQNYKNYFVPSLSGTVMIVTNRNAIKREYSFTGESHFTFARDDKGKLQTFRNGFLTLAYSQVNTGRERLYLGYSPSFSFGWLARQRGNVYEKNTFKIGFGNVKLFNGQVKLEPLIYFNDFFKGVTPGIRLSL